MTIKIIDGTAYVDTAPEAFQVVDDPSVLSVVINNRDDFLALRKLTKRLGGDDE